MTKNQICYSLISNLIINRSSADLDEMSTVSPPVSTGPYVLVTRNELLDQSTSHSHMNCLCVNRWRTTPFRPKYTIFHFHPVLQYSIFTIIIITNKYCIDTGNIY